jgi:hypothetical protein
MSHTNVTQPVLTDKQRAWANAFLRAMGGRGTVTATDAPPPPRGRSRNAPPPPPELRGELGTLDGTTDQGTDRLRRQRDLLGGEGEDIRRKKLIGKSTDKGYSRRVSDPVDRVLALVDDMIARGGAIDERTLPQLTDLRDQLRTSRTHYSDGLEGEKDRKKREQRQKKIDAITTRLGALDTLIAEGERAQNLREVAVVQLKPAERAKMLAANPEMRKAVVAGKPAPDELADLLTATAANDMDALVKEIVDAHGSDAAYMEQLCERVVALDLGGDRETGGQTTFMRGNSAATKITKAYAMTGETGEYLGEMQTNTKVWLGSVGTGQPIEIDPVRTDSEETIRQSQARLAHYVRALLNSIVGKPVPRAIATTAGMIAAGARKTGMNKDQIAVMVGGHVFLRVVIPALVTMPGLTAEQQRAMVLATKLLQNVSNGITDGGKEGFMADFADIIEEEMPSLHAWFLEIAASGDMQRGAWLG